ncbi:MAG: T9SS type A sorting domain-containing protein [Candidatus Aegiribacteria sp.]|nr:T9SS type A sorting domain-containing protein [Candidatus Aegiribacteria sp.]
MNSKFVKISSIILLSLCPGIVQTVSGFSSDDEWVSIGPSDAMIMCLHMDTTNNILFAGTVFGFQYYPFASGEWIQREDVGWMGREVLSLATCSSLPGWIITGRENAFWKGYMEYSDDWGITNSNAYMSEGGQFVDIQNDPDEPDTYYACAWSDITPGDLLKSIDRGMTWSPLTNYLHTFMTEIAIDPDNPDTVYVSGNALVTRSTDGGATWTQASSGLPGNLGVYCVAINPGNPQILVASNDNGIYRTVDGGDSWTLVNSEDSDCQHFAFNPVNPNIVVCVTFSPYRLLVSVDSGLIWEDCTGDYPGESMIDVAFSGDGDSLYVASIYSGVYTRQLTTGIEDDDVPQPDCCVLYQSSPNPFRLSTKITYLLPEGMNSNQRSAVSLAIYNTAGRLIRHWESSVVGFSNHVTWDGTDDSSREVPAGVYFVRLSSSGENAVGKLILLR